MPSRSPAIAWQTCSSSASTAPGRPAMCATSGSAAPRPEPADQPADALAGLIRALRVVGLDPDWAGLADALWLARFSTPPDGTEAAAGPGEPGHRDRDAPPGGTGADTPGTAGPRAAPAGGESAAGESAGTGG